jgi:hypothetical protein
LKLDEIFELLSSFLGRPRVILDCVFQLLNCFLPAVVGWLFGLLNDSLKLLFGAQSSLYQQISTVILLSEWGAVSHQADHRT